MALINRNQIPALLRPGLHAIHGEYETYPPEFKGIYKTEPSFKNFEQDVEMRYMGPAVVTDEGAPVKPDTMGQRVITTYIHKKLTASFVMTQETIQDNLYPTEFPKQVIGMANSIKTTEDILGATIFNEGFNANVPIGDGQPLFSTAHPIDNGTVANRPVVATDLTQSTLEEMIMLLGKFQMQSGILAMTKARKLLVPVELQFVANKILNSRFNSENANNDINPLNYSNYIPEGFMVYHYLLSPGAWFVLTDAAEGFRHFERTKLETDCYTDPATKNVQCSGTKRLSFGVSNWRAAVGSPGA